MNPEIKQRWLDALRSGEYTQGRGRLRTLTNKGAEYCCLGVLCELAHQEGVVERFIDFPRSGYHPPGDPEDQESTVLPKSVMMWAGLNEYNPIVGEWEGGAGAITLAEMNDTLLQDFSAIADKIEEKL